MGLFRLGSLLREGQGIGKDERQGLELQRQSFQGLDRMVGNPYAITSLGVMLFQGKIVPENRSKAAELYRKAADMGFAPAQFNYAMCAEAGHGMPKNLVQRDQYLSKASALNYPLALDHQGGLESPEFQIEEVRQDVRMAEAALQEYGAFLNTKPFLATASKVKNFTANGGTMPTPQEYGIKSNVQLVEAAKEQPDRLNRLQKSITEYASPSMSTREEALRARAEMVETLSDIFEHIPPLASSGYSTKDLHSFVYFAFPDGSELTSWREKSPLFLEASMRARAQFALGKLKQSPILDDSGDIESFEDSLDNLLTKLPADSNVEARLKLIRSWLWALEGFFAFARDKSVVHLQSEAESAQATVAIPFGASCGKILPSQRLAVIGGEKGELALFDVDTGGEVWRGYVPGKVNAVFHLDGKLYAQVRPQGTLEWGAPAYLWMVDWRKSKMTRLPVGLDDLSDNAEQKLRFVGDIPATDALVFFDYSCSYALYAFSPSTEKVRLIAPLHTLLSSNSVASDEPSKDFLTALLGLGGEARQTFSMEIVDPKQLLTSARCDAFGIRGVSKSNVRNEVAARGIRVFDSCELLSLALVAKQELIKQESVFGDLTFDEWSGDAVPKLVSRNSNSFGSVDRLRFTRNQSVTSAEPPYFLSSWLRTAEDGSETQSLPRFNDFRQPTVAVHEGAGSVDDLFRQTGTFNYISTQESFRNCWLAAKGTTIVGNFDGHISGEADNEVFIGELLNGPRRSANADILTLADGRQIAKTATVPRVEAAINDLRPLAMGVLNEQLSFFSTPQGLIYCRLQSGQWSDSPPVMPPGCYAGLQKFREAVNGEWLLADGSGWTHILKQGGSEPLRSPFRVRFKNPGSYIALTEDRYYVASGDQLRDVFFSYQGRAYPFEQFDLRLNRPDIVLERLGAPVEAVAIAKQLREKRLKRMGVTEEMLKPDFHVPEVEIIGGVPTTIDGGEINLSIKASDSKYPLERLKVFVNNVPVNGRDGELLRDENKNDEGLLGRITGAFARASTGPQTLERTIPIKLAVGRNKIQVSVLNNAGAESLYANAEVNCTAKRPQPTLYAVAMGVSEYSNPDWNLRYAAKDARDVLQRLKAKASDQYGEVKELLLTDREVTKESITKIKDFLSSATIDDTVLMFVAGHGLLDSNYDYYFGTMDIDFNNPADKGIAFEEFDDLLADLPSLKKSLLIDTCHAGELDEEEKTLLASAGGVSAALPTANGVAVRSIGTRGMNVKAIEGARGASEWYDRLQGLFVDLRRGSGSTILSSSAGAEYALESSEQQNGLFTYAVLEALDGKKQADTDKDGSIEMSEVGEYVKKRVAELTNNKQTPNTRRVNLEGDFSLAKTK
jgi:hypothetical protein